MAERDYRQDIESLQTVIDVARQALEVADTELRRASEECIRVLEPETSLAVEATSIEQADVRNIRNMMLNTPRKLLGVAGSVMEAARTGLYD